MSISNDSLEDFQELAEKVCLGTFNGEVQMLGTLFWTNTQTDESFLNSVTPISGSEITSEIDLQNALAKCQETNTIFTWLASDQSSKWFRDHDDEFQPDEDVAFMIFKQPKSDFLIADPASPFRIEDQNIKLNDFFETAAVGFEESKNRAESLSELFQPIVDQGGHIILYLAKAGLENAGTLLLHLSEKDSSRVGIYWVSVIPRFRRQGLATRLVSKALSVALQMGREIAVLQTDHSSTNIYERLGFKVEYKMKSWTFNFDPIIRNHIPIES